MEKIKLTTEELTKLKDLNNQLNVITFQLGDIEIEFLKLQNNKRVVTNNYENLKTSQQLLGEELVHKYGNGAIDLESGEFIKNK